MAKPSIFSKIRKISIFAFPNLAVYALLLSATCLFLAYLLKKPSNPVQEISLRTADNATHEIDLKEHDNLAYDALRDVGIAFLVAVVITSLYELHERSRAGSEDIEETLRRFIDDTVDTGIWDEVKAQLIECTMMRSDVVIKLVIARDHQHNRARMNVEFHYMLKGLRSKSQKETIHHELDYHISGENIPRFLKVHVGTQWITVDRDKKYKLDKNKVPGGGKVAIKKGKIDITNILLGRNEEPIKIAMVSEELANIPGTYCFFMTIPTKNINELTIETPPDIEAFVYIRPHKERVVNEIPGKLWSFNGLMLPGHCIEVRFNTKSANNRQPVHSGKE
jgi:hypothetical protein